MLLDSYKEGKFDLISYKEVSKELNSLSNKLYKKFENNIGIYYNYNIFQYLTDVQIKNNQSFLIFKSNSTKYDEIFYCNAIDNNKKNIFENIKNAEFEGSLHFLTFIPNYSVFNKEKICKCKNPIIPINSISNIYCRNQFNTLDDIDNLFSFKEKNIYINSPSINHDKSKSNKESIRKCSIIVNHSNIFYKTFINFENNKGILSFNWNIPEISLDGLQTNASTFWFSISNENINLNQNVLNKFPNLKSIRILSNTSHSYLYIQKDENGNWIEKH